jgi:hypothetical protein
MSEFLAKKNFWQQKARKAPLLGIGEEREWWDSDSNSFFLKAIVAFSFPCNYWIIKCRNKNAPPSKAKRVRPLAKFFKELERIEVKCRGGYNA